MLPMMQHEFVDKQKWVDKSYMTDVFAVAQTLPGAVAVNSSLLLGYRLAGPAGGLVAAFGSVLPSFLVLWAVSLFYNAFISNPYMAGALRGVRGTVVALLLSAFFSLRKASLQDRFGWALFLAALAVTLFLPWVNVIFILLAGGALRILYYCRRLKKGRKGGGDDL